MPQSIANDVCWRQPWATDQKIKDENTYILQCLRLCKSTTVSTIYNTPSSPSSGPDSNDSHDRRQPSKRHMIAEQIPHSITNDMKEGGNTASMAFLLWYSHEQVYRCLKGCGRGKLYGIEYVRAAAGRHGTQDTPLGWNVKCVMMAEPRCCRELIVDKNTFKLASRRLFFLSSKIWILIWLLNFCAR